MKESKRALDQLPGLLKQIRQYLTDMGYRDCKACLPDDRDPYPHLKLRLTKTEDFLPKGAPDIVTMTIFAKDELHVEFRVPYFPYPKHPGGNLQLVNEWMNNLIKRAIGAAGVLVREEKEGKCKETIPKVLSIMTEEREYIFIRAEYRKLPAPSRANKIFIHHVLISLIGYLSFWEDDLQMAQEFNLCLPIDASRPIYTATE